MAASTAPEEVAAAAARTRAEREAYDALKQALWRWSLATTAACFGAAYAFFSRVRRGSGAAMAHGRCFPTLLAAAACASLRCAPALHSRLHPCTTSSARRACYPCRAAMAQCDVRTA